MKSIIAFLILAIALAQLVPSQNFVFREKRKLNKLPVAELQTINVKNKKNFIISLPANHDPFVPNARRWILKNADSLTIVKFEENSAQGTLAFPNFPLLSEARQKFRFLSEAVGTALLKFRYTKPTASNPAKRYNVKVVIT